MIGYRPHPSLLSGSGGAGVDQTARDAVAASDAVNATQATEIGALKAADTAFDTRVVAGEVKDTAQDADLVALHGADTTLAGRATALEGRATSGEAKDVSQDADLTAHGTRLTSAESKNSAQDTEIAGLHTADTALAGRASALEGRATSGESKDTAQDTRIGSNETGVANLVRDLAAETTARSNADTALGDRITALSQQGYDDTAVKKSVTDETKARTDADTALGGRIDGLGTRATAIEKSVTDEAKARSDADTALGGRIDGVVNDIGTYPANTGGVAGKTMKALIAQLLASTAAATSGSIVRTYDNDVRQTASVTNFDLTAIANGATHFRVRLYGGGASGSSPASGGTALFFHGGEPGEMVESGWIALSDVDHITTVVGMGGNGNRGLDTNITGGNPGSATTVDLMKGTNVVMSLRASGGFASFSPYLQFAAAQSRFTLGNPLPGQGSRNTVATSPVKDACDAQAGRNRPTGGGGSHFPSNASDAATQASVVTPGNGGPVIYDRPNDRHGLKLVPGGAGARSNSSFLVDGANGVNPLPNVTGTAGPGGGGTATGNGGKGGFPGGGGGAGSNTGTLSGSGGNGAFDIEFGKVA